MPDHTPPADQQLADLHQQLTGPLGTATDVCGGTALRLVDEVLRGREALAREQRLHGDTIDDRDRAQDMADKLAYAVAPETVIGEHTADNSPWANALELVTPKAEVDRLRAEATAFEMLAPQQCAAGKHADWLVDSEYAHACPWCQIERLRAEQSQPIALPALWECSHGPSDDEPYCAAEDGHVCPTIRVHPFDAEAFAALVAEAQQLRATLTDLAGRWDHLADHGDAAIGHFEGPAAATLDAEVTERGSTYRKAASDVRDVVRTGLVPDDLLTTAERTVAVSAAVECE